MIAMKVTQPKTPPWLSRAAFYFFSPSRSVSCYRTEATLTNLIQINPKVTDVRVENVIDTSFMNKLESSGFIQSVYKKH